MSASAGTTYVLRDSLTMVRRNLRHTIRYPSLALMLLAMPIFFLLLFVYVFGGTMGAGLPDGSGTRADYLEYVLPALLIMTVGAFANGTAIAVAMDMTGGIIARFRTMDIARTSVLTGHVVGAVIKTALALLVLLGVATLLGYRTDAGVAGWLAAFGLLLLLTFSFTWLTVGMGLAADSVETASNTPMVLYMLPFVSSGFVPTDEMPAGLSHFAEHQPFTPMIDAIRAFTTGAPAGTDGWLAAGWCVVIGVVGYLWSRRTYAKVPAR